GVFARVDRLVEADRSCDLTLKGRVVDEVVVRERLLDHRRLCWVDPLEQRDVPERVRGIRVDHEGKVGKVLARGFGDLHLEARLDLQLDALVSTFELPADRLLQRVDRRLDTDGDAAKDPVARSPEEGRERLVRAFREEVP